MYPNRISPFDNQTTVMPTIFMFSLKSISISYPFGLGAAFPHTYSFMALIENFFFHVSQRNRADFYRHNGKTQIVSYALHILCPGRRTDLSRLRLRISHKKEVIKSKRSPETRTEENKHINKDDSWLENSELILDYVWSI